MQGLQLARPACWGDPQSGSEKYVYKEQSKATPATSEGLRGIFPSSAPRSTGPFKKAPQETQKSNLKSAESEVKLQAISVTKCMK